MYNYRIAKWRWWYLATTCREFYKDNHPISLALTKLASGNPSYSQFSKTVNELTTGNESWTVELQLFDEGDTWLIRVLEQGYFFHNHWTEWNHLGLEAVTYDNRSDVPPEDEKNAAVAQWVDEKILAAEYFLYPLLSREDLMDLYFETGVE